MDHYCQMRANLSYDGLNQLKCYVTRSNNRDLKTKKSSQYSLNKIKKSDVFKSLLRGIKNQTSMSNHLKSQNLSCVYERDQMHTTYSLNLISMIVYMNIVKTRYKLKIAKMLKILHKRNLHSAIPQHTTPRNKKNHSEKKKEDRKRASCLFQLNQMVNSSYHCLSLNTRARLRIVLLK